MILKDQNGSKIEVSKIEDLFNPVQEEIEAKMQEGQNEQSSESFAKKQLTFPSGEKLPLCWLDPDYRLKSKPE